MAIVVRVGIFIVLAYFFTLLILQDYRWPKAVKVLAFIFSPVFVVGWLLVKGFEVVRVLFREAFR